MALTRAQIEAKTYLGIKAYRNSLAPSDPEIPVIDAWIANADIQIDMADEWKSNIKAAIGSNPPGPPPPPPGLPA
jgi:hypothetical protein